MADPICALTAFPDVSRTGKQIKWIAVYLVEPGGIAPPTS